MIKIKKSTTADTRSCDYTKVSQEELLTSSVQHIDDVAAGLEFFVDKLREAAAMHDFDKVSDIEGFHRDFLTGFKQQTWYTNHKKVNRHHLLVDEGIPEDVNLIDVIEMITDVVMAGMGRTGNVYPMDIEPELLVRAFENTVDLLKKQVEVEDDK